MKNGTPASLLDGILIDEPERRTHIFNRYIPISKEEYREERLAIILEINKCDGCSGYLNKDAQAWVWKPLHECEMLCIKLFPVPITQVKLDTRGKR